MSFHFLPARGGRCGAVQIRECALYLQEQRAHWGELGGGGLGGEAGGESVREILQC